MGCLESLVEAVLLIGMISHTCLEILNFGFQIPVLVSVSLEALIKVFRALHKIYVVVLQLRLACGGIFELLVLLCERSLEQTYAFNSHALFQLALSLYYRMRT